ncbi:hypothetical protein BDW66DRAFT_141672 [Aspergillus desertorum]
MGPSVQCQPWTRRWRLGIPAQARACSRLSSRALVAPSLRECRSYSLSTSTGQEQFQLCSWPRGGLERWLRPHCSYALLLLPGGVAPCGCDVSRLSASTALKFRRTSHSQPNVAAALANCMGARLTLGVLP